MTLHSRPISLLCLLFLFLTGAANVRAEDCWSQVAQTADPELTVETGDGQKLSVHEVVAFSGELTPPMMIFKALAGVDYFIKNQLCVSVYVEALSLLDRYVAYRKVNAEAEWREKAQFSFADEASAELKQIRSRSEEQIAVGAPEKLWEMILWVTPYEGTWFRAVINLFDRNDLARISISCKALQYSAVWRSALVTRTEGIYAVPVVQVSYCNFSSLGLLQVQKYYDTAARAFGHASESHIHQIVTDPAFLADADWLTREPLWAYFSVWNWTRWQDTQRLAGAAKSELSQFYQSRMGMGEFKAERLAKNALGAVLEVGKSLPIPEQDIRVVILHGGSISEISHAYATRVSDGFDDVGYRYLRERDYLFRDECPDPSYTTICKFGLFYDAYYRWEEHLALIGTPEPPLLIAVLRPEVVTWLLDAGEDIEQVNQYGKTALMTAVHLNQMETVRLLLARGADVNHRTYGEIKVDRSLSPSGEVGYLLDTIRKPRSLRHAGRTALMYAAENADAEIIDMLLSAGANPCLADSKGLVPSDYFDGNAPSRQANPRVQDKAMRERLIAALSCPTEKRILPAPFPQPAPPETP